MLPPRLQLIYNHINKKSVADIGTDHAIIPIELIKNKKCSKVIASDIKIGPVKIAKDNIKKENLIIEVRMGAGLSVLKKDEVEQIIIAGMGGKLIASILDEHPEIAKNTSLILQPMNGVYELRYYLINNGYKVENEDIAIEGDKVYNLIKINPNCISTVKYNTEMDLFIPSYLKSHRYFNHLKNKEIKKYEKIVEGQKKSDVFDEKILKHNIDILNNLKSLK